MSQPEANGSTITEAALEEFRKAGVPIEKGRRPYQSKRMVGFNAEVYAGWIERWANNAAANYSVVRSADGVGLLRNAAKDVPAVVVGIGPSLDEEILALKLAPRHAVVIATDAALRPMLRHGIKPDLVVNYDAKDEQATMWESIDTSDLVLLASSCTSPKTLDAWKGKVIFFNMRQDDDEFASNILPSLFPYIGQLPNMGTVGNGAVFLAWQMGCKPILTVGMDLCYQSRPAQAIVPPADSIVAASWKYRCQDWTLKPAEFDKPAEWQPIENKILYDNDARLRDAQDEVVKGKTYKTDNCLMFYRNSLVSGVGQFDIPLINCSGGVLTDLVKSMPLKKAIEEKCYAALEPGRTIMKHLFSIVADPAKNWSFIPEARIFVPKSPAAYSAPDPKR